MHIPDVHRKKLDDKSQKCIFLGISDESKAYRLYDPIKKKILFSKDVIFDENDFWKWEDREHGGNVVCDSDEEKQNNEADLNDNSEPQSVQATDENVQDTHEDVPEVQGNSGLDTASGVITRAGRVVRNPAHFDEFIMLGKNNNKDQLLEGENIHSFAVFENFADPISYNEAVKHSKWRKAMDSEMGSIEKNETWSLVDLPQGAKTIGVKWIYKTKYNEVGEVEKHKARLVAKGYAQQYGIDYSEVFAPVARWDTIRCILAIAAQQRWSVYQLDVRSAFLHGELTERVYVCQPEGYVKKGQEAKVYQLRKALYGLKQAPRAWYSKIDSYFAKEGFKRCAHEHTLFTKTVNDRDIIIISLYVDDLLCTGSNSDTISEFKEAMKQEFDMSDLGKMRHFLGMEVIQDEQGIFISQQRYAGEVLTRFGLQDSKPVYNPTASGEKLTKNDGDKLVDSTYFKQIVGSLMYLNASRPDIMYTVSIICRFMEKPAEKHLTAAKRILRYLKGTLGLGIHYKAGKDHNLVAYCDSDYAGDLEDRKSTSGFVFMIGSGAVSWCSKKQPIVTLSSTEAEYVAATYCVCQGIWLKRILEELCVDQDKCLTVFCDNSFAIKLSKNPVLHGRSKHIDVRFHFLRNLCKE